MKKRRKGRKLSRKDLQKIIGDDLKKLTRDLTLHNLAYTFPPDPMPMPKPPKPEVRPRHRRRAR
jgi:hypothetical protein